MANAPGWYPDPNDPSAEIYWDGTQWHGRRGRVAARPPTAPTPHQAAPPPHQAQGVKRIERMRAWVGGLSTPQFLLLAGAVILVISLLATGLQHILQDDDYRQCVRDGKNELSYSRPGGDSKTEAAIEKFCEREFGKYIWS